MASLINILAMKRLYLLTILLISIGTVSLSAQNTNDSLMMEYHSYERYQTENLLMYSSNPASLYELNMPDFGTAALNFRKEEGHSHRPQQPKSLQDFGFNTQRFQSLESFRFSGNFSFKQTSEINRNFCDVLDPYRNIPYVFANENGGDWKKQHYELGASASTFPLWKWLNTGIKMRYKVATGARENDPRPLNLLNNIKISPGVMVHISENHLVGLSGYYEGHKEEINLMIKSPNESFTRYLMLGLGQFTSGTMSSGYDRTYFGDTYGSDIQYIFQNEKLQWLTQIGFFNRIEHVRDQISRPKKGGKYSEQDIKVESYLLLNKPMSVHQFALTGQILDGDGTEFKQNFDRETERWITFSKSVNYNFSNKSVQISYETLRKAPGNGYNYKAKLMTGFQNSEKEYYLPESFQQIKYFQTNTELTKYFNNTWRISLAIGYYKTLNHEIKLSETDEPFIQEKVTLPDYEYLKSDKINFYSDVSYYQSMPMKLKKALFKQWFLKAWINRLEFLEAPFDWKQSGRYYIGLSAGIVY